MSVAQLDTEAYYTLGAELSRMWIKADEKLPPAMMPVLALVEVHGTGWLVWTAFMGSDLVWSFPFVRRPGTATVRYWIPEPWCPVENKAQLDMRKVRR